MNALIILLVAIAVLVCGYVFYGGWLAKQWGIDPNRPTPAHEFEDGKDYVPAAPYVVLGHHFSSIAGAGPINGPIQAAIFGWVPVLLWVLIGGIFFGAMHDFGALFASIRHKGQTLATVIAENIDDTAKKLFCIFSYLTLILVVAAFASIVASTFAVAPVPTDDAAKAVAVETGSKDYVPAAPYVVLGHHFSSIAGAGPINGPIQAAIFGWVPVLLWVLIGGIFFGAMHDFGALFASIRHKGQTLATVIAENIDDTAKKLFCIFSYLTLILVVAAFASIVASTFAVAPVPTDDAAKAVAVETGNLANMRTAMISVLFIVVAVIYGVITRGRKIPAAANIVSALAIIVVVVALGYNLPVIALDNTTWMILVGLYILVASVAPVWILLQPRDYLSSYLLYGMIALALVGIIGAGVMGNAASLDIPAFTGFSAAAGTSKVAASGFLFPALFITIACGAISGFHSLVASGTTSKQLDREAEAQPIAYGGMLLECLVAVISLCAVAFVFSGYMDGTYASPTQVFAAGLSQMLACVPGLAGAESVAYALLVLAVSVFCLTSLDTATRLGRYMFQELFTPHGMEASDLTGWRAVLVNPWVATIITVVLGVGLGMTGYQLVWPLFGAANQLLAALGLLAVCAWLGNAGRNNKMFYVPMAFMMVVTLTSLALTVWAKIGLLAAGTVDAATVLQLVIGVLLMVFAVILAVKGCKTIFGKKRVA